MTSNFSKKIKFYVFSKNQHWNWRKIIGVRVIIHRFSKLMKTAIMTSLWCHKPPAKRFSPLMTKCNRKLGSLRVQKYRSTKIRRRGAGPQVDNGLLVCYWITYCSILTMLFDSADILFYKVCRSLSDCVLFSYQIKFNTTFFILNHFLFKIGLFFPQIALIHWLHLFQIY